MYTYVYTTTLKKDCNTRRGKEPDQQVLKTQKRSVSLD